MSKEIVPIERVAESIRWIRGHKVRLNSDLALLYRGATKMLNQAVKRNQERFPDDFMFQLNADEQGIAMLSSVLNSDWSGERTRLACWRWRPCHRELFLSPESSLFHMLSRSRFSARRRKEHARRVCSSA